jgi:hypothetical protein
VAVLVIGDVLDPDQLAAFVARQAPAQRLATEPVRQQTALWGYCFSA